MYTVVPSKDFQKSLGKLRRSGRFNESLLEKTLLFLAGGDSLPMHYEDHILKGDMSHFRQCHIKDDLLLQYKKNGEIMVITLGDIGTHHQLLGR